MSKNWLAASGRNGRLTAARLLTGEDLVEGILDVIRASGFKSGSVQVIGAMSKVAVLYPKDTVWKENPGEVRGIAEVEGPIQIGSALGVFGTSDDGRVVMHIHGTFTGKGGRTICGDPVPGASPVWLTADVVIQEFEGINMKPVFDEELDHEFFHPESHGD